ncbi:MAG: hypothetical protein ACPGD5_00335 [Salibacteraceae bacterium]
MYRTKLLTAIIFVSLLIVTAFSCKKEDDEVPTNTGVFAGMTFSKKVFIPNTGWNTSLAVSNQYIYFRNDDGLIQMDFEGNYKTFLVEGSDFIGKTTVQKDGKIYVYRDLGSSPRNELLKINESGTIEETYKWPENHRSGYGLNLDKNYVYLNHKNNKYGIDCFNIVTGDSILTFGSNGPEEHQFPKEAGVLGADSEGYIYAIMQQGEKGMIFNGDGEFFRSIPNTLIKYHLWNGGYYVNDYTINHTSFNNAAGESQGRHYHNRDANGYEFLEEISPDRNTAIIKQDEYFYIYTK